MDPVEAEQVLRKALDPLQPVLLNTADFYTSLTEKDTRLQNIKLIGEATRKLQLRSASTESAHGTNVTPACPCRQGAEGLPAKERNHCNEVGPSDRSRRGFHSHRLLSGSMQASLTATCP